MTQSHIILSGEGIRPHCSQEISMVDHLPRSSLFRAVLSSIPFTLATYGGEAAAQSQRGFYYATSVGVASGASLLGARVVRLAGSVGACPRGGHRSAMAHHSQPRARVLGWDDPVRVASQLLEAGVHRGHGRAAVSSVGGSITVAESAAWSRRECRLRPRPRRGSSPRSHRPWWRRS